jgi:integrase/recombinase XerC
MTLDAFREDLIATQGSLHTVHKYLSDARAFETFRNGETVSVGLVRRWARSFDGNLNPQTVERKLMAIRCWLVFKAEKENDDDALRTLTLLREGRKVVRGARERDSKIIEPVSEQEFTDAMERARRWNCEWMRALMGLLWWAGPRISEVVGDTVAQIPYLSVTAGRALVEESHVQILGKGGKRRWLVLPSVGRDGLGSWMRDRLAWAETQSDLSAALAAPLFASPVNPGRPVSWQRVNQLLHEYGLRGAHGFRHAYASRLRAVGVREETVAALLGHRPRTTTAGYGRVSLDEMQEAAEKLVGVVTDGILG